MAPNELRFEFRTATPVEIRAYALSDTLANGCSSTLTTNYYPEEKKKIEQPKSWPDGRKRKPWEKGMK